MGDVIRIETDGHGCTDALVEMFGAAMANVQGRFEQKEAAALKLANELVRRWIERELQAMAGEFGSEVVVGGERYRQHCVGAVRYHSLCGTIAIRRHSSRQVGVHNGPTIVPLELRAGLIEHATPALAFSVTQGFAERPLRHYEAEMEAAHRAYSIALDAGTDRQADWRRDRGNRGRCRALASRRGAARCGRAFDLVRARSDDGTNGRDDRRRASARATSSSTPGARSGRLPHGVRGHRLVTWR